MRASVSGQCVRREDAEPSRSERSMRLMLLVIKIVSSSIQLVHGAAENASRVSLLSQSDTVDLAISGVVYSVEVEGPLPGRGHTPNCDARFARAGMDFFRCFLFCSRARVRVTRNTCSVTLGPPRGA